MAKESVEAGTERELTCADDPIGKKTMPPYDLDGSLSESYEQGDRNKRHPAR